MLMVSESYNTIREESDKNRNCDYSQKSVNKSLYLVYMVTSTFNRKSYLCILHKKVI